VRRGETDDTVDPERADGGRLAMSEETGKTVLTLLDGRAGRFPFPRRTVKISSRRSRSGSRITGKPAARSRRRGSGPRSPSSRGALTVSIGARLRWTIFGRTPNRRALRACPRLRPRSSRGTLGREKEGSSSCFSRGTRGNPPSSEWGSAMAANRGGARGSAEGSRRSSAEPGTSESRRAGQVWYPQRDSNPRSPT